MSWWNIFSLGLEDKKPAINTGTWQQIKDLRKQEPGGTKSTWNREQQEERNWMYGQKMSLEITNHEKTCPFNSKATDITKEP